MACPDTHNLPAPTDSSCSAGQFGLRASCSSTAGTFTVEIGQYRQGTDIAASFNRDPDLGRSR